MFARLMRIAPRRGWRAFIGEVGIIVLGVLIAVGIGKVVEALDWRDKVASARAALENDVREGGFNLIERVRTTPCLRRQLDRLEMVFLGKANVGQSRVAIYEGPAFSSVYVHPMRSWAALQWNSTIADNIPVHMTAADRSFYSEYYREMVVIDRLNMDENEQMADIDILARPVALDQQSRLDLLRTIIRERQRVDLMDLNARYVLRQIARSGRRAGLAAGDPAQMNTLNWCRANGLG